MMNHTTNHDVESQVEPQLNDSDMPVTSVRNNKSGQWKSIALAIVAVAAVIAVIAVPVAVTQSKGNASKASVNSDSNVMMEGGDKINTVPQSPFDNVEEYEQEEEEEEEEATNSNPAAEEESPMEEDVESPFASMANPTAQEVNGIIQTINACPALNITALGRSASNETSQQWTQMAKDIVGEAARDNSGLSIDMSADGSIVAIGAIMNDGAGSRSGHVRVYKFHADASRYIQLGLDVDGEGERAWFGSSVALDESGLRLAAGGIFSDADHGVNTGHVRVFDYNFETDRWEQVGQTIEGKKEGDQMGSAVSLSASGTRLAVSATHADGLGNATDVGHVYMYDLVDGNWQPVGGLIDGDGHEDLAGKVISLSADGTHVAVAAPRHDDDETGASDAGRVRVYRFSPPYYWKKVGQDITSTRRNQQTGFSLSLSSDGSRVAVGYPEMSSSFPHPGVTRVFEVSEENGDWWQLGNDLVGSHFVSMSETGRVAVGDYSSYQNGINSGTVRVYDYESEENEWDLVGQEIHGNQLEMSGIGAVLSADGSRLAISSPLASTEDNRQVGATRVYDLC